MSSPSSSSSTHNIPLEIIDQIILQCDGDWQSLKACSLASRIFVPSCRYVKFSTIRIGYGNEDIERLVELLKSPLSTVRPVLKRVRVCARRRSIGRLMGPDGKGRGIGMGYEPEGSSIRSMEEHMIHWDVFRDVRSIQFDGVLPATEVREGCAFWRLMGALRGATEVQVETRCILGNVRLLEWICELREVEELLFVRSTEPGDSWKASWMGYEKLEQLKLGSEKPMSFGLEVGELDELDVVKWVLNQSPVPRVRHLKIGGATRRCRYNQGGIVDAMVMRRFFEVCGHDIERLHIGELELLKFVDINHCHKLRSVHIEGLRVGSSSNPGHHQARTLEMGLEKMFVKSSIGPQVNCVALTIQVDPYLLSALRFFGLSDVTLFRDFEWGKVPEILERGWLGHRGNQNQNRTAGSGNKRSIHSANAYIGSAATDKELVLIIQGGSKYGREQVEEVLRRGAFRVFDEQTKLSVQFDS